MCTIWGPDTQHNFYKYLRESLALDAEDYDERSEDIIEAWKRNAVSDK